MAGWTLRVTAGGLIVSKKEIRRVVDRPIARRWFVLIRVEVFIRAVYSAQAKKYGPREVVSLV